MAVTSTAMTGSGSADVAALGIVEHVGLQADPGRGREKAHRHRLLLLQRDQNGFAVVGRLSVRIGHASDVVAFAQDGLERLLFLCMRGSGKGKRYYGEGSELVHEF